MDIFREILLGIGLGGLIGLGLYAVLEVVNSVSRGMYAGLQTRLTRRDTVVTALTVGIAIGLIVKLVGGRLW